MPHETRPWATTPNEQVMKATAGGKLLRRRVRLHLDPRAFETDDANELRVEGIVMAVSSNGPMLMLEERDVLCGGTIPLIDILVVEKLTCDACHGTKEEPLTLPSGLTSARDRRVFMRDFPDRYSEGGTRVRCDGPFHRG